MQRGLAVAVVAARVAAAVAGQRVHRRGRQVRAVVRLAGATCRAHAGATFQRPCIQDTEGVW